MMAEISPTSIDAVLDEPVQVLAKKEYVETIDPDTGLHKEEIGELVKIPDDATHVEIAVDRIYDPALPAGSTIRIFLEVSLDGGQTFSAKPTGESEWPYDCFPVGFQVSHEDDTFQPDSTKLVSGLRVQLPAGTGRIVRSTFSALQTVTAGTTVTAIAGKTEVKAEAEIPHSVAFDAASASINLFSVSSASWTHTAGASANYVQVGVGFVTNTTPAHTMTATYAGNSMGSVALSNNDGGWVGGLSGTAQLRGLVNPATGAQAVNITFSAGAKYGGAGSVSYSGVDTTTPTSGATSAQGSSATASVDVSSVSGDMVSDCVAVDQGYGTLTVGAGQTQRFQGSGASIWAGAGSTEAGASTVTMSWSLTSTNWISVAANIKAGAASDNVGGSGGSGVVIARYKFQ